MHYPISPELIQHLTKIASCDNNPPVVSKILPLSGYSNKIVRLILDDGRSLIVKRARNSWAGPMFESANQASLLLRNHCTILSPEHVYISTESSDMPVLAYWYIPSPTLNDLWPDLSYAQRTKALRSLGRMLKEIHEIKVAKYGLLNHKETKPVSIALHMEEDVQYRLKPAAWDSWPDARPIIERLSQMAGDLPDKNHDATLVHNDLHFGNILCEMKGDEVQCIGLLDLEAAAGGVGESDLASAMILHDPIFADNYGQGDWLDDFDHHLLEGYGTKPDPDLLLFFQAYHLINLGYSSALNGDTWHARKVTDAIENILN